MAGFLKKVAGAFVYLEEDGKEIKKDSSDKLDEMSRESGELLAQLSGSGRSASTPKADSPAAARTASSALEMTADEVFTDSGLTDSPGSAQRVLKIIAGLSMFSKEQQAVMVRAMDAADDSWSEKDVLEDARRRQSALRRHLQAIETERADRQKSAVARIAEVQAEGKKQLEDLDRQIAELQKQRQDSVAGSTASIGKLEQEQKETEEAAEKARRGITAVINAFSDLITFFVGESRPTTKP